MGITFNFGVEEVREIGDSMFVHVDNSILWIEFTKAFLEDKEVAAEKLMKAKIICLTIGSGISIFSFMGLKSLDEISELKILAI